ncbi:MAG: glycolate oxidase subunit GlcE [marine bacterium B5-7]|nr:MAG: glycolate oxidase subunit GlcE [marine bacterium B5-7]
MHIEDIAGQVITAFKNKTPLCIRGGGSKDFLGRTPMGQTLLTTEYHGIVDYDPAELVLTARCGTPVEEVESLLREHGQMLPFEPPLFEHGMSNDRGSHSRDADSESEKTPSGSSTVGGMVAAGLSGPRRPWSGSVRDYILGTVCVNGCGEVLKFGGQVMKNVAGYDVSRLMTGSLGTLGVVVEASFKVLPAPIKVATRMLEMDEDSAHQFLKRMLATPTPIDATCYYDGQLYIRLSGSESGVGAGEAAVGGEQFDAGDELWRSLRNQNHEFFTQNDTADDDIDLWRLSLPPATPVLPVEPPTLVEWGGAVRWLRVRFQEFDHDEIESLCKKHGGHAIRFRSIDREAEMNPPADSVSRRLFENLKASFDPAGILNPGRLYRDL